MCQPFAGSDYYNRSATSMPLQLQLTQSFPRPTMTLPTFTSWYVVRLTVGSLFTPVGHKPSVRDLYSVGLYPYNQSGLVEPKTVSPVA